jgi:hypothetical protein
LKLVQETAENTLKTIRIGNDFLSRTQQLTERINIKLKSFCTTKEMFSKLKRPSTEWEKIFASHTSYKGPITRIYRELKTLTLKKSTTQ